MKTCESFVLYPTPAETGLHVGPLGRRSMSNVPGTSPFSLICRLLFFVRVSAEATGQRCLSVCLSVLCASTHPPQEMASLLLLLLKAASSPMLKSQCIVQEGKKVETQSYRPKGWQD